MISTGAGATGQIQQLLDLPVTEMPVFDSATVAVFAVATAVGWLVVRSLDFTDSDWQRACQMVFPADTYLDAGEWEQDATLGIETIFVPSRLCMRLAEVS